LLIEHMVPPAVLAARRPHFNLWDTKWRFRASLTPAERLALTKARRKATHRIAARLKRQRLRKSPAGKTLC